eukprot:TRINITY_DN41299_c0_g1_i2.p1 TRINITY_DN41299_c0_g1~~TRINITY_DN41299_c0_g1_i2.p1  ORF type:complete len:310 (-),score=77.27 TRINITY_DN41299_c0_g1_i2:395-1324(-)
MAVHDRRLLSFPDPDPEADPLADRTDAEGTLFGRLHGCQQNLAEIEKELCKYQLLLGTDRIRFRPREREYWVERNRRQPDVKERYAHLDFSAASPAQRAAGGSRDVSEAGNDRRPGRSSFAGVGASAQAPGGGVLTGFGGEDLLGSLLKEERSQADVLVERVETLAEERQLELDSKQTLGAKRRPSASLPSSSGAALAPPAVPSRVLGTIWVQVDNVVGIPRSAADQEGFYAIEARWKEDADDSYSRRPPQTEERQGREMPEDEGRDECVIRQQLRLESFASGRFVVLTVLRDGDAVAKCELDVSTQQI